jgi:hypothetical protein
VDTQRAAELQVLLEGVPLPATRDELVAYAQRQQGGAEFVPDVRALTEREYDRLDEVGEELLRAQPPPPSESPLPRAESGEPPGGDDYTNPSPQPGQVRLDAPPDAPPQKTIDERTATQKLQQQRQERGG